MIYVKQDGTTQSINYICKIYTNPIKYFSVDHDSSLGTMGLMDFPTEINNKIDPLKSTIDISSTSINLVNEELAVSRWLYNNLNSNDNLKGTKADIIIKLDGIEQNLFTGIIENISNDPLETNYNITIKDIQSTLKQTIFKELQTVVPVLEDVFIPTGFQLSGQAVSGGYKVTKLSFQGHAIQFCTGIFEFIIGSNYADFVDLTAFDKTDTYFTSEDFYFEFTEKLDNPIDFMQKKIFRALNVFPYITNEGKYSLVKFQQPSESDFPNPEILVLDESSIISVISVENDFSKITNNLLINTNYDYTDKEYDRLDYYLDGASYDKYGNIPFKPLEFNLQGCSSSYFVNLQGFLDSLKNRVFNRYSDYLKKIKIKVFFSKRTFNIGDIIVLVHNDIIDWDQARAGERGLLNDLSNDECIINQTQWGDFGSRQSNFVDGYRVIELINNNFITGTILLNMFNRNDDLTAQSITNNHDKIKAFMPPMYL